MKYPCLVAGLFAVAVALSSVPAFAQSSAAPSFDAPRLTGVTIDGSGDDWGDRGLRVDALAPVSGGLRPAAEFAPRLRVGWDDSGLLVLVTVHDAHPIESASNRTREIYTRDSVELFLGARPEGRDWLHWQIAPGVDPEHIGMRVDQDDRRATDALRALVVKPEIVTHKTSDGYVVEARLPWAGLGVAPRKGVSVAFQCAVNNVDSAEGPWARVMWYPVDGASTDPTKMLAVRLADKASPPVTIAALADARNYPRVRLRLFAPADVGVGKIATAGGRSTTLTEQDGWATGALSMLPNTIGPVPIVLDKKQAGFAVTGDAVTLRRRALDSVALNFHPAVFAGDTFPDCDFAEPGRVEDLIGPYTFDTKFYGADFAEVKRPEKPGRYGAVVTAKGADGTTLKRYLTLYRMPGAVAGRGRGGEGMSAVVTFPSALGLDPETVSARKAQIGGFLEGVFTNDLNDQSETAALFAGLAEIKPTDPVVQRNSWQEANSRWWPLLRSKTGELKQYAYSTALPKEYDADPNKKWPLLLFLHGSGERGSDLKKLLAHGPLKEIQNGRELPFVVIAPQCPEGGWWDATQLGLLLDEVQAKYRIDPSRVYCTGLSMGGYGTWALTAAYPDRFAAVAPICGQGDPADAARMKTVPIWSFHGGKDPVVPIQGDEAAVNAVKAAGGDARLTIYPDAGHDSWSVTYANDELYRWLLSHVKK